MEKAVGAILWHCTEFDDNNYRHRYCPEDSWCPYKQSDNKIDQIDYVSHINLPKWIHDTIKPIFADLSDDNLLSKCLHRSTKNVNEALNKVIWNKCPKEVFVERKMLEIGVYFTILV